MRKSSTSSTQQRVSTGRFAALINSSIENTDQDDFIPSTQHKRTSQVHTKTIPVTTTKRKLTNSFNHTNTIEQKRTKKSTNLFQDVVSVPSIPNSLPPPPPWLDLPTGLFKFYPFIHIIL